MFESALTRWKIRHIQHPCQSTIFHLLVSSKVQELTQSACLNHWVCSFSFPGSTPVCTRCVRKAATSFRGLAWVSHQCPGCGEGHFGVTRGACRYHERASVIVRLALVRGSPEWAPRGTWISHKWSFFVCSFENLSCFIFYCRGLDFSEFGRLLSSKKNCTAYWVLPWRKVEICPRLGPT